MIAENRAVTRPVCRDQGLAGDGGGSRGRSRARDAVIKDQFMIMEPRAGDRPAAPAGPPAPRSRGTPQSPAQQQRPPAWLAAQAGRVFSG
jgi:hypothetical protein